MSRHELVLTTAWAAGVACAIVAAVSAWMLLTDPAELLSGAGGQTDDTLVTVALHVIERAVSTVLSVLGW